jgi:LysM repeat protein
MAAIVMDPRYGAPGQRRTVTPAARRSAVVGAFALVLAASAVWARGGAVGRTGDGPLAVPGAGPSQAVAAHVWVVQPGDTVWAIARQLQPHGDVRPLVDFLDHEVHDRPLQVGQQLQLP